MKPFERAEFKPDPHKFEAMYRQAVKCYPHLSREDAEKLVNMTLGEAVYLNDRYQVSVREFSVPEFGGDWVHLSIKRLDREPIHDWRDLQEIKNKLVGRENEAVDQIRALRERQVAQGPANKQKPAEPGPTLPAKRPKGKGKPPIKRKGR